MRLVAYVILALSFIPGYSIPAYADMPDTEMGRSRSAIAPQGDEVVMSCDYSDLIGRDVDYVSRVKRFSHLTVRVLKEGQMVTQEYMARRVNLLVDAQGKVTAITCG